MPNDAVNIGLRVNPTQRMHALNLSTVLKTLVMQANAYHPEAMQGVLDAQRHLSLEVGREPGQTGHLLATLAIHTGNRLPRQHDLPAIKRGDNIAYVNAHGDTRYGVVVGPHWIKDWDGTWDVLVGKRTDPIAVHPRDLLLVTPYAPDAWCGPVDRPRPKP